MKSWIKRSFKRQQFVCFLAVALLPLLVTCTFLTQIVQIKVENDKQKEIVQTGENIDEALIEVFESLGETADLVANHAQIVSMIDETGTWVRSKTYELFYSITMPMREYAIFDILNREGRCVYSTGSLSGNIENGTYWGVLKAAQENKGQLVFQRADFLEEDDNLCLRGARSISDSKGNIIGYLVIRINEKHFDAILQKNMNSQIGIAILDSHWKTVYSTGIAKEWQIGEVLRERLLAGERLEYQYNKNDILISSLEGTGMIRVMLYPEAFSSSIVQAMYSVIIFMAISGFVLCLLVANRMSISLSRPIMRMNDAMHKVQEGDLKTRIPVDRQDELGQMSENFNIMVKKLDVYMQEQVRIQQKLNESQIAMMQAQMNPHFLYNTLDTMKWLAKANHVPEIATMSTGLARILRTSISKKQFIYLKEEIELVTSYAQIQKIRYNDRFQFQMIMPQELAECIVPKLVIQPIVENALIHGLEECDYGYIEVQIYQSNCDSICIEVKDNGCGIREDVMENINQKSWEKLSGHIGLYNIDTIIRLHYGEQYGLQVRKNQEQGTLVTIRLPINWK